MNKELIPNKTLSIRISTDGFCFCNYIPSDPQSLQYVAYPADDTLSLAANLDRAIEECPFIGKEHAHEILAIIETSDYTILPFEYDDKQEYKIFYRNCFPKCEPGDEIVANRLPAQGFTVIFPVAKEIHEILQRIGNVTYFTPASILMGYISRAEFDDEKYMLMYLNGEQMLIMTVEERKVKFSNSFTATSKEDLLFYMLSIWKEQGLSQTDDALYLCGNREIEEMQLLVSKFIKNRKRINPNEVFAPNLLNRTQGIPFDLQALILCE